MTDQSTVRRVRPEGASRPMTKGRPSPLRHWPWALLVAALAALLAIGWSAAGWYPQTYAPACPEPECLSRARLTVNLHWAGTVAAALLLLVSLLGLVRARASGASDTPARLSPMWHGAVVGVVVLVLATGALVPTVLVGILSPPLGVAVVLAEWVLLAWLLERMHLAARPATSPRRRLRQSLVVAGCVIGLEILLPLVSPAPALAGGMLQLALVQAGVGTVATSLSGVLDGAPHADSVRERRIALAGAAVLAVLACGLAVTGLDLGRATMSGFAEDLLGLTRPW